MKNKFSTYNVIYSLIYFLVCFLFKKKNNNNITHSSTWKTNFAKWIYEQIFLFAFSPIFNPCFRILFWKIASYISLIIFFLIK